MTHPLAVGEVGKRQEATSQKVAENKKSFGRNFYDGIHELDLTLRAIVPREER